MTVGRLSRMPKVLGLVLAGGEGRRLLVLTKRRAKPILLFGGIYRIIDFVLSNLVNSKIHNIGILTQYAPDSIIKHLGFAWHLDRDFYRIDILFPQRFQEFYLSPADAVLKRLDYLLDKNPRYVLIVPGDYVSLINYQDIINFHEAKNADLTIAGTDVKEEEAYKFGMITAESDGRVVHYVEKPKQKVDTNFASMGIYVFNFDALIRNLCANGYGSEEPISFTYHIIPRMVEKAKVFAYKFNGYWRDLGTIQSYLEANLELIKILPELNLYDLRNPIRSRVRFEPPPKICEYGYVKNSIISQSCIIDGHVERSIIFPHVKIEKGAYVYDSLIMPNNHIGENAVITRSIIDTVSRREWGNEANIGHGCVIGGFGDAALNKIYPNLLNSSITLIGMESYIPKETKIGKNCLIDTDIQIEDFNGRRTIEDGESLAKSKPTNNNFCLL